MASAAAPTPVLLVLLPGTLLLDLAGMAEPLRIANDLARERGQAPPFALHVVAGETAVATSLPLQLAGCEPLPTRLPDAADTTPWVVLIGTASRAALAPGQREAARTQLVDWLRAVVAPRLVADRARLWTVCSGALLAARAGLFDGRDCTTHHDHIDELRALAPRAQVQDNRIFVVDGPVASSAGITAGIDLALAAVQEHAGHDLAARVARELVVYWRRAGGDPQISPLLAHRNHLHTAIHRAQDAVLAKPAADWSLPRLAAAAHVSPRHLRRLFQQHAGIGPLHYVQRVRLALLRQWQAQSRYSADQAAQRAGFSSARQARDAARQLAALDLD
jgi:transcriptional regulator GlxA family with amidase domain